ncbi:MAG: arylsulfatase [Pirellulaceae bacterium]|nr:arylsulfatase [Pirellulaceae bacterium]
MRHRLHVLPRALCFSVGSLVWLAILAASSRAAPPNVVLILADDLGFSDLGCYGSEIATPNLDRLAQNGLRFTQFYNTARCWPTRGALLTGYYAQQIRSDVVEGIPNSRGPRPAWARLLPELLKPAGYRSYHSGKWHITGMPLAGGFDRSYLLQDGGRHFSPRVHFEDDVKLPPATRESGYYSSTAIADHAVKCLRDHAANQPDQPFFSFIAFTAPHFPLHAPPEDIAKYKDKYTRGWDALRAERWKRIESLGLVRGGLSEVEREVGPPYHFPDDLATLGPGEVNRPLPWNDLTPEQQRFQADKMAIHAAMIDRMDREIGRVLDQVRAMNALDNTLICFLSDNGATAEIMVRDDGHDPSAAPGSAASHLCLGPGWSSVCNTPHRRHKTWVHEGGISTPLVVHWPRGFVARGELRHHPAHLIDIAPTILDLAGQKWPAKLNESPVPPTPGRSLFPGFSTAGTIAHDYLWWLHEGNRAVRVGDWKLVAAKGTDWELFNLAEDRSETKNLAATEPDRVRKMADLWAAKNAEFGELAMRGVAPSPPAKGKNKTKAKSNPQR